MILAILVSISIWMSGFWMGELLTSEKSGFVMKHRQSLLPFFFYTRKRNRVILPAVLEEGNAYTLLSIAFLLKLLVYNTHAEHIITTISVFWLIMSFLYFFCVNYIYYSRVHRKSPEKLITILEDIGFPAERFLYVRATLISIDGEIISRSGRTKYICTIRRKRDGKLIHQVLLEDDGMKCGDKVKASYFSSGLTSFPYTIITR